jgi:hypothetical protein
LQAACRAGLDCAGTQLARKPDMADHPRKKGRPDRDRINIDEEYELRYWSEKLDISPEQIQSAVAKVGPMVKDVRDHLALRD